MHPSHSVSRRQVISAGAAAAAFTIVPRHVLGGPTFKSPSEKLNIAGVGIGGMGTGDVRSVAGENIVALCDVDQNALANNAKIHPKACAFHRFPQDAGYSARHRRGGRSHSRPQPRGGQHHGHENGQARPLPKAADPLGIRGSHDG